MRSSQSSHSVIIRFRIFFRIHSFCWLLFLFRRIKEEESLSSSPLGFFAKLHYVLFPEKAWYSRCEAILSYGTVYHLIKNGFSFRSMKGTDWQWWRSTFVWCRQHCSQSFSEENGRVESPGDEVVVPLALKRCRVSERPDLRYLDNAFSPFYFSRERKHWYTHSPSHQLVAFFSQLTWDNPTTEVWMQLFGYK